MFFGRFFAFVGLLDGCLAAFCFSAACAFWRLLAFGLLLAFGDWWLLPFGQLVALAAFDGFERLLAFFLVLGCSWPVA